NLCGRAVLATSYFNDRKVQRAVEKSGTRLLPKFMLSQSRIEIEERRGSSNAVLTDGPLLVLIEDDFLVHELWGMVAQRSGKKLMSFLNPDEFWDQNIDERTPIYIDRQLQNGISGVELAKALWMRGFRNIYLATGEPADKFIGLNYISGVVG